MKYTVGSLFAGVGGICLGFKNAKTKGSSYTLSWANEIDEYACETYKTNFDHLLLQGDIEKIIHPTRIDSEIEVLRKKIKSLEKDKDDKKSEITKLSKAENGSNNETQISKLRAEVDALSRESESAEQDLTELLETRDAEFEVFLNESILPSWIEEQNRLDEFKKYTDLRAQIIANPIDVLNGGFPCQAFSIAGERHGFKDPRGNLFLSIVDLIELLGKTHTQTDPKTGEIIFNGKPRILFLENVKNLKNHDNGRTYTAIKTRLEQCGYTIFEHVLNTMEYSDLPQNRERIYIIGFRDQEDAKAFTLFKEDELSKRKVKKNASDRAKDVESIIDYDLTSKELGKYYYTKDKYPLYYSDEDGKVNLNRDITERYQFYQVRRGMYVRKNQSNVCPTLTANMGTGGHNVPLIKVDDGIRKITPAEVFRLQGFPVGSGYTLPTKINGREYGDAPLYKQAGNAVSVPIITLIAKEILKILERR